MTTIDLSIAVGTLSEAETMIKLTVRRDPQKKQELMNNLTGDSDTAIEPQL